MASTSFFNEFELVDDILDIDKLLNEEDDEIWLVVPLSSNYKKRQSLKQKRLEQVDRFKTHVISPTEFLMAAAEYNTELNKDLGMKSENIFYLVKSIDLRVWYL